MSRDPSTEEKIKNAARSMFMKKGYAATKTRDIAEEAGLNLALLNYYFRSKENLFQQIMMESLTSFFQGIKTVLFDESTSLEEKFTIMASRYIDQIRSQPDTPMFILSELRANPDRFISKMSGELKLGDSAMFRQLVQEIGMDRIQSFNPVHIVINLMSLIAFPFLGRPMLERIAGVNDEQFNQMMEDRKKLIPVWIMQMLKT